MNKLFKRVASGVMAMCICTALFTTAYADTHSYSLRNIQGAPSSANVHSQVFGSYSSGSKSSLTNNCTTFSTDYHSNGTSAYVTFTSYYVTSSGTKISNIHEKQYIQRERSTYTVSYTSTVPAMSTIYTTYQLENYNSLYAQISGTLTH